MTASWIGILLTVAAIIFVGLTKWRYRIEMAELGTVSEQWLAEHRAHNRDSWER